MFFVTTSIVSFSSAVGLNSTISVFGKTWACGRPHVVGLTVGDLDVAVGGVVHELPLEHVAPVRGLALVVRQTYEQRGHIGVLGVPLEPDRVPLGLPVPTLEPRTLDRLSRRVHFDTFPIAVPLPFVWSPAPSPGAMHPVFSLPPGSARSGMLSPHPVFPLLRQLGQVSDTALRDAARRLEDESPQTGNLEQAEHPHEPADPHDADGVGDPGPLSVS